MIFRIFCNNYGLLKNQRGILRTIFDLRVSKKTKSECLVGLEGLLEIIMFLNTCIHIPHRNCQKSPGLRTKRSGFEYQVSQVHMIGFFLFCQNKVNFLKTNAIWLIDIFKMFFIVEKRKNQFGFLAHPFLFSVYSRIFLVAVSLP